MAYYIILAGRIMTPRRKTAFSELGTTATAWQSESSLPGATLNPPSGYSCVCNGTQIAEPHFFRGA
jgi:hypothetical protein